MAKQTKKSKSYTFDIRKVYSLSDALDILKGAAQAKFDETVEIAINLNIDARKADQNVRGVLSLPHGTGKVCKVAVFARGEKAKEALDAGADLVGAEDLSDSIQKGSINFDRCVATPDMMGVVGRVARVLGPRGLMPNPKLGTVTLDIASAIKAVKGGQVEYRSEKGGVVHSGVGKISFDRKSLEENIRAFVDVVSKAKPIGAKGVFVKKITLSSTMGPGLICDLSI